MANSQLVYILTVLSGFVVVMAVARGGITITSSKKKPQPLTVCVIALTVCWLGLSLVIGYSFWESKPKINEIGDFVGGFVAAPLAFLWLVFGLYMQGQELKQNTKSLRLQHKELQLQVKEMREQARATSESARATEAMAKQMQDAENHRLYYMQPQIVLVRRDRQEYSATNEHGFNDACLYRLKNHGGGFRMIAFMGDSNPDITLSGAMEFWSRDGEATFKVMPYRHEDKTCVMAIRDEAGRKLALSVTFRSDRSTQQVLQDWDGKELD